MLGEGCCTSGVKDSGDLCSETMAAPCIIDDDDVDEDQTCSNGLPGYEANDVCCPLSCGTCGGVGCSQLGEGCCTSGVKDSGDMCSETMAAPCIIDDDVDEEGQTCSNGLPGYEANDVCCPLSCGTCGGVGCSQLGEGCCTSGVKDSGDLCSETMAAPCIIDDDVDEDMTPAPTPAPVMEPAPTPAPVMEEEEQMCTAGVAGILEKDVCCPLSCGECGAPTKEDVVKFVEGTSIVTVLNCGVMPGSDQDSTAAAAAPPSTGAEAASTSASSGTENEQRHYYVDVQKCFLDHVIREPGKELVTPIESWSMSYTKTRRPVGSSGSMAVGAGPGEWDVIINSFLVNGKTVADPGSQMSFLHLYATIGSHTKMHVYGNTLVQHINKDEALRSKLMESTWNTVWLHYGLLNTGLGPMTFKRTEANKWSGLASPCRTESLLVESLDMSSLGGCNHAKAQRWKDLDLPLSTFMLEARKATARVMLDHDIPMEFLEAMFLSGVMHAIDHVQGSRLMWGLNFELDLWEKPTPRRPKICESTVWNLMWAAPTLNPVYNNQIRHINKPFYRQLYRELKAIDTLNVADEITASIMY
eukprot:g14060.t1